jgi:uncharacterized protein
MTILERIADGRTDLVVDHVASGRAASALHRGTSLIKWCAYHGDVSAIRFLISHGERIEGLGENLDLNGAAFHGHWRLVQYLVEQGADVNHALPDTGETPLHAAASMANRPDHEYVIEILLANGADPNVATKPGVTTGSFMRDARTKGETPLHRAAAFCSEQTIQRLLQAGAAKQARDASGDSPLSWASWHLRPAPVLRLLCFDDHGIHPGNSSTYDHGWGWKQSQGRPHT